MTFSRRVIQLLVAMSLLVSIGCSTAAPSPAPKANTANSGAAAPVDADMQAVIEAAKKEGNLVIYEPGVDETYTKPFTDKYPFIKVDTLNAPSSQLYEKLSTEYRAEKYNADIFGTGITSLKPYVDEGLFQPYTSPATENYIQQVKDIVGDATNWPHLNQHYITLYKMTAFLMVANTNKVKPDEEPKSWNDLLLPRWKGKMVAFDPRARGMGFDWFQEAYKNPGFGVPYLEKMAKQDITFREIVSFQNAADVARGEWDLAIQAQDKDYAKQKELGLPIKAIIPKEGFEVLPFALGLLKKAPHPNAAKLYIDFYLSKDGQEVVKKLGGTAVIKGVDPLLPELSLEGRRTYFEQLSDLPKRESLQKEAARIFFSQ